MAKRSSIGALSGLSIFYKLVDPGLEDAWAQRPTEKDLWYGRFLEYLLLGRERSINQAFTVWSQKNGKKYVIPKGNSTAVAPGSWYRQARDHDWTNRARAHDRSFMRIVMEEEVLERFEAHRGRLQEIKAIKSDALAALEVADLHNMTREEAQYHLNTLRQLYGDMLKAERLEFGEATETTAQTDAKPAGFSADDLAQAEKELEQWLAENPAGMPVNPMETDENAEESDQDVE